MACFIIATISGGGSLFQYFSALGRELDLRGHRVIILVDRQRRDEEERERNPSVLTWPSRQPTSWRDAHFLHTLIRRHGAACVIGNFTAVNICTLIGWLDRVPVRVAWSHTLTSQIDQDVETPRWKLRLLRRRRRFVYKFVTHFLVSSRALAEDLRVSFGVRPDSITVLPFLLPDPPTTRAPAVRANVIYSGRLSPAKGVDVLIRAVPTIRAAFPDVFVDVLGDGPMRDEYERLAASLNVRDACRFLGAVPLGEVYERMASAAVVAVPSRREAFGLVNVEAQSVGTPVVGSDIDGIREIVMDGKTGFLVPPDDAGALAERIILLLKNEDLRRRLGQAGRAHFEASFSNRGMSRHADFFESLITGKR